MDADQIRSLQTELDRHAGDQYLPESWAQDRVRCREAIGNGVRMSWLTLMKSWAA